MKKKAKAIYEHKKISQKEEISIMKFLEMISIAIKDSKKLSYNKELSDKAIPKGILNKNF